MHCIVFNLSTSSLFKHKDEFVSWTSFLLCLLITCGSTIFDASLVRFIFFITCGLNFFNVKISKFNYMWLSTLTSLLYQYTILFRWLVVLKYLFVSVCKINFYMIRKYFRTPWKRCKTFSHPMKKRYKIFIPS